MQSFADSLDEYGREYETSRTATPSFNRINPCFDFELRFNLYIETVCAKCQRRDIACGCELGSENSLFVLLRDYAFFYCTSIAHVVNFEVTDHSYRWITVDFSAGLGNQLLKFVNALQIALASNRILVLKLPDQASDDFKYNSLELFDPIIPWMTTDFLQSFDFHFFLDDSWSTLRLDLWTKHGVELLMCSDFASLSHYEVIHLVSVQDPHLPLANSFFNGTSRQLHGLPFFFLSHLLWTGRREAASLVHAVTLPAPAPWDGQRPLGEVIALLRGLRPTRIVSVHIRVAQNLEYLDTYHYPAVRRTCANTSVDAAAAAIDSGGVDDAGRDFCFSEGLGAVAACVLSLLQLPGGASPAGGGGVVVLWATDSDDVTAPLLEELAARPGVQVVRLLHKGADRHDAGAPGGMADLRLLEEGDEMAATPMSTFSFAAHARGLITPHYFSFRDPCGSPPAACSPAAGPEAGLLATGRMYDRCVLVPPAAAAGERRDTLGGIRCGEARGGCASMLLDPGWSSGGGAGSEGTSGGGDGNEGTSGSGGGSEGELVGCLDRAARCLRGDVSFASR